jgi:predicted aspartyl protease
MKMSPRVAAGALSIVCCALPSLAWADCKVVNYGMMQVEVVGQRATTMVGVNGKDTRFMLDTGATYGTLARANVEALGLKREGAPFGMRMSGVGGSTSVDLTRVKDLGLLGVTLHDMTFLVGGSDTGMGVIGANLIDVFDADIDLANGQFKLFRPSGCGSLAMAYWAKDGQFQTAELHHAEKESDRRSFVDVMINGRPVRALLDTGAQATEISRRAAERVGLDLSKADAGGGLVTRGVGGQSRKSWILPVDTYAIGTETIQHNKMLVIDGDFGEGSDAPDMLLGIDFFLAHHVYIANSQHKIYFTYNGGRMFTFGKAPAGTAAPAKDDGAKLSAADYALRGQGHLSRGNRAGQCRSGCGDRSGARCGRLSPDARSHTPCRAQTR